MNNGNTRRTFPQKSSSVSENFIRNSPYKIENLILSVLQKNPLLTIVEIAEKTGVNRLTASKYLYSLEMRGVLGYRAVGNAKLFYVRKAVVKA